MTTLKILLVEDHSDSSAMMARILGKWGCAVKAAGTVADADRLAASESFDVLLCDLGLPDGTGCDLLRSLLAARPIRAVVVSGYADVRHVEDARKAGFSHYLVKPFVLGDLQTLLTEAAADKRVRASPNDPRRPSECKTGRPG